LQGGTRGGPGRYRALILVAGKFIESPPKTLAGPAGGGPTRGGSGGAGRAPGGVRRTGAGWAGVPERPGHLPATQQLQPAGLASGGPAARPG